LKSSSRPNSNLFDRSFEYDFEGRIKTAKTGAEARGETIPPNASNFRPYRVTWQYNEFGDISHQQRLNWDASFTSSFNHLAGRVLSETESRYIPGWENQTSTINYLYDADGRLTSIDTSSSNFDADGHLSYLAKDDEEPLSGHANEYYLWNGTSFRYDGNGKIVSTVKNGTIHIGGWNSSVERREFRVFSSLIGDVITRIESDWHQSTGYQVTNHKKSVRSVFANGNEIAERRVYEGAMSPSPSDQTVLKISDPAGVDKIEDTMLGSAMFRHMTLDPFGADADNSYPEPPPTGWPDPDDPNCVWNDFDDYECEIPDEYETD
jgi:hypothetical protein